MPITEILTRNATYFRDDVALVEINPDVKNVPHVTWREFSLIESSRSGAFKKQITWGEFDVKANRFANLLLSRGVKKGEKVAILLMNCLDWLPIYFGILKSGAVAVPLNYRYTAEEIKYCVEQSDSDFLVFGPEFIGRVEEIHDRLKVKDYFYVGDECPSFADSYEEMISYCSSQAPSVYITDEDDGAIYFSSGTTGFPKAILHAHKALVHSARVEQAHHGQKKDDVFLCIPLREQGGTAQRHQPRRYHPLCKRGTLYNSLAARSVGAGYTRRHRQRQDRFEQIRAFSVETYAHRRAARASHTDKALESGIPAPRLRHKLRTERIDRSRLCSSGR